MKIYPSKSQIEYTDKVDSNMDIPLAYINSDYIEKTITININNKYNYNKIKEVLPYDEFSTNNESYPEITLYNKDYSAINTNEQSNMLIRESNTYKYIYYPKESLVFEPYIFYYNVLAKKKINYTSSRKFNIKVACSNEELAKEMIQYFSDKYDKNLFPSNVIFNNGDKSINSLVINSLKDIDFMFIRSNDGIHYTNNEKIDLESFIEYNTIPFIICDSFEESKKIENPLTLKFLLKENIAMSSDVFESIGYFTIPKDDDGITFKSLFTNINYAPVLIKEFINTGYVVYCHSKFIEALEDIYPVFYNILIQLYLNNYVKTGDIKSWITDTIPDYIIENGRLVQKTKFTSNIELHKLLNLYENDAYPINVTTFVYDKNNIKQDSLVYYTGMSSNYLVFKKLYSKDYSDPIKQNNQISIYTSRNNIMYYDNFIYTIEEDLTNKITCTIIDNTLSINIKPFKNTFLDTRTLITQINFNYELKDVLIQSIYLIWNYETKTIELKTEYNANAEQLAEIIISKDKKTTQIYDMRLRGGGLEEESKDNYDCFDISNILGKSYRKGGSLIATIKLPLIYKKNENDIYAIVYEAIRKNMIADDYLILNIEYQ